ncbi:MAG: hypothetical protein IPI65_20630 [Bacteroidetes bacterium]|nr:hypothetical protein [Bacteroidota bacterium]
MMRIQFLGLNLLVGRVYTLWLDAMWRNRYSRILIIFDYAYESKCETGILAGDTIGDTSGVSISELNIFKIYSFNNNIYVNIPNYQNTQITVYDITGNKIYNKSLKEILQ